MAFDPSTAVLDTPAQNEERALTFDPSTAVLDESPQEKRKSIGGFAENVVKSTGKGIGGILQTVTHPVQTARGFVDLAGGVLQKVPISPLGILLKKGPGANYREAIVSEMGKTYKERYGGLKNISETFYNDPFGSLMDLSMLFGGVGGALGKFGEGSRIAKIGSTVSKAGEIVDPLRSAIKSTSIIASKINSIIPNRTAVAGQLVNSLIKPLQKDFSYGKNPGLEVAKEGIVGNSLDDLGKAISKRTDSLAMEIKSTVSKVNTPIDTSDILNNTLDKAIKDAKEFPTVNKSLIARLQGYKDDLAPYFGKELTPSEASIIKTKVGRMRTWTEKVSEDNIINGAIGKIYGELKTRINKVVPGVAQLNEKEANLISAEEAVRHRNNIIRRSNLIGFSTQTAGLGTGLITAILTGGKTVPTIVAGALAGGINELFKNPYFVTRFSKALAKQSPKAVSNIMKKIPELRPVLIDRINSKTLRLPSVIAQQILNEKNEGSR